MGLTARTETIPEIPKKIKWRAKLFGEHHKREYLEAYYRKASEKREIYYLPYLNLKENFDYLRRYAGIPRKEISMVLIDGNDGRIDYFISRFLEELNDLTIITGRKHYFEGFADRAFQELGLLIELIQPWEEKKLWGNLVWDFTKEVQKQDCYPKDAVCFAPHKKEGRFAELLRECPVSAAVTLVEVTAGGIAISPELAETLLVPKYFPFRESRCEELGKWCREQKWSIKMKAVKPENS